MDKLLANCQKHLQTMCHDEILHNMIQMYRRHAAVGGFVPGAMIAEAKHLTYDEVYTFHYSLNKAGDKMNMFMQYVDTLHTDLEKIGYRELAVKNAAARLNGNNEDNEDMTEAEKERSKVLTLTNKMRVAKKKKTMKRKGGPGGAVSKD